MIRLALWLVGARAKAAALLKWLTGSTTRMFAVVIALLLIVVVWQHQRIGARDATIATLRADNGKWAGAFGVLFTSFGQLESALKVQNGAIHTLKAESARRVQAGQDALRGAVVRSTAREALATRIDAQRPAGGQASGQDCPTSAGMMAAKGEL